MRGPLRAYALILGLFVSVGHINGLADDSSSTRNWNTPCARSLPAVPIVGMRLHILSPLMAVGSWKGIVCVGMREAGTMALDIYQTRGGESGTWLIGLYGASSTLRGDVSNFEAGEIPGNTLGFDISSGPYTCVYHLQTVFDIRAMVGWFDRSPNCSVNATLHFVLWKD